MRDRIAGRRVHRRAGGAGFAVAVVRQRLRPLLLIKIVLTVVLMILAWRNRARWLPAAKSHRVTAYVSRSRSLTELAIMAVALTMAAALSIAG